VVLRRYINLWWVSFRGMRVSFITSLLPLNFIVYAFCKWCFLSGFEDSLVRSFVSQGALGFAQFAMLFSCMLGI
jgi:hypothetical protein